jgi:hypothetical protein
VRELPVVHHVYQIAPINRLSAQRAIRHVLIIANGVAFEQHTEGDGIIGHATLSGSDNTAPLRAVPASLKFAGQGNGKRGC